MRRIISVWIVPGETVFTRMPFLANSRLRNKRSVQLTAAGATFLREVQEILRRAGEAQRLAQRAARGEVGTLGIGFFGTASAPFLPTLVKTYRRTFPGVELRLLELDPDQQLAAFDE